MSVPGVPPPVYTTTTTEEQEVDDEEQPEGVPETQLLISTGPDNVQFQKGYLGADGERAAIEGEVQVKGGNKDVWNSLYISSYSSTRQLANATIFSEQLLCVHLNPWTIRKSSC